MLKLNQKLPRKLWVGFSAGPDSTAALHFLSKKHDVTAVHIDHDTPESKKYIDYTVDFCNEHNVQYEIIKITQNEIYQENKKVRGQEWAWAFERHSIFEKLEYPTILGHHLDDAVETWIMSSLNGCPRLVKKSDNNIRRPFLLNKKQKLIEYCDRNNLKYVIDPTNNDGKSNKRSIIRQNIDVFLKLNSGIHTTIRNKLIKEN